MPFLHDGMPFGYFLFRQKCVKVLTSDEGPLPGGFLLHNIIITGGHLKWHVLRFREIFIMARAPWRS